MALGAVAANAQAIQTVEIQGTVDSWYTGNGMYVIDPALLNAATFKFMVNQDISVAPYSDTYAEHIDSEYKDYYNNVRRIGVTFYDSEGVEISTSYATEVLANEMISSFKRARNDRTADELFFREDSQWGGDGYAGGQTESITALYGYLYHTNAALEMFSDFSGYPQLINVLNPGYTFSGWIQNSDYEMQQYTGAVTSVLTYLPDDDLDGVMNDVDTCPVSIMDETVMFKGWYDSGVTNYVDASGCTVADHYAACAVEEQEAPVRGIRSVRSGPSNCEKAVSYDLVADGVISYSEARMLRNALYNSYRTTERR